MGQYKKPLPKKAALFQALEFADWNWHRGHGSDGNPNGSYLYGKTALQDWIDDLKTADTLTSDKDKFSLFSTSSWCLFSLYDARKAAVQFLRDHAPLVDAESQKALLHAADLYAREVQTLDKAFAAHDCFLCFADKTNFPKWTPAVRQKERSILTDLLQTETEAIAQIEKCLAAHGTKVPVSGLSKIITADTP